MGNQHLKVLGEDVAARHLEGLGFKILSRNWRVRFGELDIVAIDKNALVFVEVKTRASEAYLPPEISVDHAKRMKLRRLAETYVSLNRPSFGESRFDVISVVVSKRLIRHIPDAF